LKPLSDIAAERAVLAGICQYGKNCYVDISDVVEEQSFTSQYNKLVFSCLKKALDENNYDVIDLATIYSTGKELGLSNMLSKNDYTEHIDSLFNFAVDKENIRKFAAKIKKLQITRTLRETLENTSNKLLDIEGNESITQILGVAEEAVFNFSSSLNNTDGETTLLGDGLEDYINYLADNPVEQLGIPTGFPRYDKAIGGGLRPGTVNVIAARAKALAMTSKILTPAGWTTMSAIKVGDAICNPENKTGLTTVTEVLPQGKQEAYEFEFSDGAKVIACKEHLWKVKHQRWPINDFRILSFEEMCSNNVNNDILEKHGRPKWQFPVTKPIMLNKNALPIDAYVLGCLLGDGCIKFNDVMFSSNDPEIINNINSRLPYKYKFTKKK